MQDRIYVLRERVVKITQILTGKGILVTQRGLSAYVEYDSKGRPFRVNLPYVGDQASDALVSAIEGFLDHEVAHVLFSDFEYLKKSTMAGKRMKAIHNVLEDCLIEKLMPEKFPGSAYNIEQMHNFFIQHYVEAELAKVDPNDEAAKLVLVLVPYFRALAGQRAFMEYMRKHEAIVKNLDAKLGDLGPKLRAARCTKDTFELAGEVMKRMAKKPPAPKPPVPKTPPMPKAPPTPPPPADEEDGEPGDPGEECAPGQEGEGDEGDSPQEGKADRPDAEKEGDTGSGKSEHDPLNQDNYDPETNDPLGDETELDGEGEGDEDGDEGEGTGADDGEEADGDADEGEGEEGEPGEGGDDGAGDEGGEDGGDAPDPSKAAPRESKADKRSKGKSDAKDDPGAGGDTEDEGEGASGFGDEDDEDEGEERESSGDAAGAGEGDDEDEDEDGEEGEAAAAGGDEGDEETDDATASNAGDADGEEERKPQEDASTDIGDLSGGEAAPDHDPNGFDALDAAEDFDESVAGLITGDAQKAARGEKYLPYTKDFDSIEKLELDADTVERMSAGIKQMEEDVLHHVGVMQKDLERAIAARSRIAWQGGLRSGRLHGASLSRLAANDTRVFRKREEHTSKNVAMTLLVDLSGSMNGTKVKTACEAAYALSQTLERIGIKHEVLGFSTGHSRNSGGEAIDWSKWRDELDRAEATLPARRGFSRTEPIYMPIFKGFDERLTAETKARFVVGASSGVGMANNIDGESVEYAAQRLAQRKENGKLLMVLSDGAPHGAGDCGAQHQHLVKVVRELPKKGIKVVGLGILTDTVAQFYPKHLHIKRVDELPGVVMKELRGLLLD